MTRIGKQPPRHRFILNPFQDVRFTRCPRCEKPTRVRKFPLLIHVHPMQPVALNKTCRYCPPCDLLIAHKDEVEAQLAALFGRMNRSEAIGSGYLVIGTLDRAAWRRGLKTPLSIPEMTEHLHDFEEVLTIRPGRPGDPGP